MNERMRQIIKERENERKDEGKEILNKGNKDHDVIKLIERVTFLIILLVLKISRTRFCVFSNRFLTLICFMKSVQM